MRQELVQTQWARVLLGGLAAAGIRRAVLSPGGRSTPFAAAALATAGLECLPVSDERVAAFVALGQARATAEPVLLLCTSGTAGAHYLPAVIEAAHAHLPLVIVTADRPPELHHCGAPQTIEQTGLFGGHTRHCADLGPPGGEPAALRALLRHAAQAVLASRWPLPGPVHLNAPARKPLEPVLPAGDDEHRLAGLVDALLQAGPPQSPPPPPAVPPEGVAALAELCRNARRGLLVAGPAPPQAAAYRGVVARLAAFSGFPLLAEGTSQLLLAGPPTEGVLALSHWDALLATSDGLDTLAADLVLQLGAAPVAASWPRALRAWEGATVAVVAPHGWQDPTGRARLVVAAPVGATVVAVADHLARAPGPGVDLGWRRRVAAAAADVAAAVARECESSRESLDEVAAVRQVVGSLPAGATLVVGNSLPVRDLDLGCPAGWADVGVASQRGASGIDGLVSGAAGAALAGGRPVVALVGDVSFLHDLGGLAVARRSPVPLVVVVLNNGGGQVFGQLPVATSPAFAGDGAGAWLTPPELDLAAAAAAFGVEHRRVVAPADLAPAMATALGRSGCTVVEAVISPEGVRAERERLARAVTARGAPGA